MSFLRSFARIQGMLAAVTLLGLAFAWAEPPAEEVNKKPSTYAPAKDLEYQFTYLLDRMEDDLKDESKFDRRAKRVVRDASTIAALALVLAKHDEANSVGDKAGAIIDTATKLAANATTHADAAAGYARLKASLEAPAPNPQVEWQCVADIEQLMLQVPQLDTSLKSNTKPSRFSSAREKSAGIAATLAAIAQVSMFDRTYCQDEMDYADWVELCACMRDAAKDVHQAIQDGDPDAAEKAVRPLTRTCDDCHEQFRD